MPAFKTIVRATFAATIAAAALSAIPAAADDARMLRVHHSDLNLSRTADRAVLEARIRTAARIACRPGHDASPVMNRRACITDAARRARAQLDHLMVEGRTDSALIVR